MICLPYLNIILGLFIKFYFWNCKDVFPLILDVMNRDITNTSSTTIFIRFDSNAMSLVEVESTPLHRSNLPNITNSIALLIFLRHIDKGRKRSSSPLPLPFQIRNVVSCKPTNILEPPDCYFYLGNSLSVVYFWVF